MVMMNYSRYQMPKRRHSLGTLVLFFAVVIILAVGGTVVYTYWHKHTAIMKTPRSATSVAKASSTAATSSRSIPNMCADNSLDQNIIVSITRQHLWACADTKMQYDSAVVTGMQQYPADLTPTGTYRIYGKQLDLTLRGSDGTGSWSDPVSYWMPFLDNQYGVYGFHDATWRAATEFGHVDINAPYTAPQHGSHGCVELPLATAKWLYDWATVGTTVTIQD